MVRYALIFLLILPFWSFAQRFIPNPDWRFENFNSQNHFISRAIEGIATDKYGYVWTCGQGIQRFDGYKTIDFNRFDPSKGALRNNATSLVADNTGRIWITSAGLCYYDDASGRFVYVEAPDAPAIVNAFSLCTLKNNLWFICNHGLIKLDVRTLKMSYTSLKHVPNPLYTYAVNDTTLLIADREKLYIYNIKSDTYSTTTLVYHNALLKIFGVIKGNGVIFLGTNYGLFTITDVNHLSPVGTAINNVFIGNLLFMPQDKEKKYLFVATGGGGVIVYNTIEKKIHCTFTHNYGDAYSLLDNDVSGLYADKDGRLWIGTAAGLSMLDRSAQQWKIQGLNNSNSGDVRITRILRDRYDTSKVWLSCHDEGIAQLDWKTKKIEHLYNSADKIRGVLDFVQLSKTNWLLATTNEIINWSPQKGIISVRQLPVTDSVSLLYIIRRLFLTDAHTCFITSNKGLFKDDLLTQKISAVAQSAPGAGEDDILKHDLLKGFYKNGKLWLASRNGLFCYDVATGQSTSYSAKGISTDYFFIDAAEAPGNKVICSGINGIGIFDGSKKNIRILDTIDNLFKPCCESVVCLNNKLWIGTETGLISYDLVTRQFARAENAPQQLAIVPTSPFAVIDNSIVGGYNNQFAIFTPGEEHTQPPSDPVIESILVNNQQIALHYEQATDDKLVFGHLDNSINISFTSFLYTGPDDIKFRYKLVGADDKWQEAGSERSANYAQLSPGDYTFYVQCGNKNGIWNGNLASVAFTIKPPYWATWWFRLLVLALIVFILYKLYEYRVKNILAIERIREKIASDFHDDIGSALSSISIFSEVADKQLSQHSPPEKTREIVGHISSQSRAMLDAMDDIVWAVNPQNDHINDLAVRMREFAIPLLEASDIRFDINIPKEILNTKIKMSARKNIFMIFKECINNILKHSGCTAMKVSVIRYNNQLELIISDNGKGFDKDAPSSRNGMKNLKRRAAEIDGRIEIITQPGHGTVIKLLVDTI